MIKPDSTQQTITAAAATPKQRKKIRRFMIVPLFVQDVSKNSAAPQRVKFMPETKDQSFFMVVLPGKDTQPRVPS